MVANILPTDTPLTQGLGQKVKLYLFLKVVMLHIKLKFDDTGSKYFAHRHTLDPGGGVKMSNYIFSL